jgi:hypothetical protein
MFLESLGKAVVLIVYYIYDYANNKKDKKKFNFLNKIYMNSQSKNKGFRTIYSKKK